MSRENSQYDVIVVGAGAAGLMAAAIVSEEGVKVLVIEKNHKLGKKLAMTGGGRCNITNAEFDTRAFLSNYGSAKPFLFSPFSQFSVADTFAFFNNHNLPLVTQALNRVFPKTEKAQDVCDMFSTLLLKNHVTIKKNCQVLSIKHGQKEIESVKTSSGEFFCNALILATGGVSHPETGSTGDGFKWLKELGHTIKTPTPTIVPLSVKEKWITNLSGTTLSDMKITFFCDNKKMFSKTGRLLFTHFGLSGPLILNSAGKVAESLRYGGVRVEIDIFPKLDIKTFTKQVIKSFDENKNKELKNVCKEFLPSNIVSALQFLLKDINFEKKVNSVTVEERQKIIQFCKAFPLTIKGLMGEDRAVAADGGVILEEIDMRTMCSKLYANLYIIGDLLHINRPSGGYSLQICWTTGCIAGKSAATLMS